MVRINKKSRNNKKNTEILQKYYEYILILK